MAIDPRTQVEAIADALIAAVACFKDEHEDDEAPTHLYLSRTTDGEWSAVFLSSEIDELDAEMTRWAVAEDAERAFELVETNNARAVAGEIAKGWDVDWDD